MPMRMMMTGEAAATGVHGAIRQAVRVGVPFPLDVDQRRRRHVHAVQERARLLAEGLQVPPPGPEEAQDLVEHELRVAPDLQLQLHA